MVRLFKRLFGRRGSKHAHAHAHAHAHVAEVYRCRCGDTYVSERR
ncbi:MAG TPA: hypothetical protein VGX48_26470 [Pyrinomonadaceae bacterium]|jgi:hypothetical protein|nr:hypothetical protein [Pyrinomonadaceae bacterium]